MSTNSNIDIHQLSQSERILLAEELWDSVATNQDLLQVTDDKKKVLDERIASYKNSPDEVISWNKVKNEMK
jgi:putative addiction module component (TIGR02574 family)